MAGGTKIGDAFITLRLDRAQAEKDARSAGESISSIFSNVIKADAIEQAFSSSIKNASNLNAAMNNTKVIFGSAQDTVIAFGRDAATSFGLSTTAFLKASDALGHLLQNVGYTKQESADLSAEVIQAGANLAAAFNKDTGDVIETLTRGIAGQTRGLKSLGIVLNEVDLKAEAEKEGLYDGTGALDAHAKAAASVALILQQTSRFQGDFAATTNTAAQAQRIARAESENASASLGQNFLPIYTRVVQIVGAAAKVFGALPGPIQVGVLALGALIAFAGPIAALAGIISDLSVAIGALELSTGGVLAVLGVVAAALGAFALFSSAQDTVAVRSKQVAENLATEVTKLTQQATAAGESANQTTKAATAQELLSKALTGSDKQGQETAQALGTLGLKAEDASTIMTALNASTGRATDSSAAQARQSREAEDKAIALTSAFLKQHGVVGDIADVLAQAGAEASIMGTASDATKDKTKDWSDANKKLFDSIVLLGKAAGSTDLTKSAQDFLNSAYASDALSASLIRQAENSAHASRNGDDAQRVLSAYLSILQALTPEQRAAAEASAAQAAALGDEASAADDAAGSAVDLKAAEELLKIQQKENEDAAKNLGTALKGYKDSFDLAADAAKGFSDAIDKVFNPTLNLEKANENLNSSLQDIIDNVHKTSDAHDQNSRSLDINTETGRKNRELVLQHVEAIIAKTKADIANGVSVDDATRATDLYRQQLETTLKQLGFNKDEVDAYVASLGLTPDQVKTAIELEKAEESKNALQGILDQLTTIDAGAQAEIQALIDNGSFDEAAWRIKVLTQTRTVTINTQLNDRGGILLPPEIDTSSPKKKGSAVGRFVPGGSNLVSSLGEKSGSAGDEVVLPLGDPGRMRELLSMPGVGSRVSGAMGNGGSSAVHIENAFFNSGTDAESVAQIVLFKIGAA